MSSEKLNFIINNDGTVHVRVENSSGIESTRIISFNDMINSLQSDDINLELPLFPRGLRKYKAVGQRTVVGIEYPPSIISEVRWRDGTTYKNIPTPGSVWLTLLGNNADGTFRIIKNNLYALDAFGLVDDNTALYAWPFPNYSRTYGAGVCWGNDKNFSNIKNNATLNSLSSLYNIYFSAGFNNDLGYSINKPEGPDDTEIFDFLEDKPKYNSEWIKKLEVPCNFKEAVRRLIGD